MLRLIESLSTSGSENSLSDFPWLSLNQSEVIEQVCFPSLKIFSNLFAVELVSVLIPVLVPRFYDCIDLLRVQEDPE